MTEFFAIAVSPITEMVILWPWQILKCLKYCIAWDCGKPAIRCLFQLFYLRIVVIFSCEIVKSGASDEQGRSARKPNPPMDAWRVCRLSKNRTTTPKCHVPKRRRCLLIGLRQLRPDKILQCHARHQLRTLRLIAGCCFAVEVVFRQALAQHLEGLLGRVGKLE